MTRALGRLLSGDLAGALEFHPLILLMVMLAAGGAVWMVGRRFRGWAALSSRTLNIGLTVLGVAFFGVWLVRMAAGTLPPV
jgi:hypothetical protein